MLSACSFTPRKHLFPLEYGHGFLSCSLATSGQIFYGEKAVLDSEILITDIASFPFHAMFRELLNVTEKM